MDKNTQFKVGNLLVVRNKKFTIIIMLHLSQIIVYEKINNLKNNVKKNM